MRQEHARPPLEDLKGWLEAARARVSDRSDVAAAIRYAQSRWTALTHYVDDGTIALDNNTAERPMRPVTLGRKNRLFAGSDAGGQRAAAIYSLAGTAKLNGLDATAGIGNQPGGSLCRGLGNLVGGMKRRFTQEHVFT